MWKNASGELIHVTDATKKKFRTNISNAALDQLKILAKKHVTHVNYFLLNSNVSKLLFTATSKILVLTLNIECIFGDCVTDCYNINATIALAGPVCIKS